MLSLLHTVRRLDRIPELTRVARHTSRPVEVALHYLGLKGKYPLVVPLRGGGHLTLHSRAEVRVFWHIFVRSCYHLPAAPRTIIDAGGNVGLFAVWAARRNPDAAIHSFEPSPETFERMERNLESAGVTRRVNRLRYGLAATAGTHLLDASGPSPDRQMVLTSVARANVTEINCITLTEAIDSIGGPSVDFLKMDIEGAEWEVLLTTPVAHLARIRQMQVEYHAVNPALGYSVDSLIAHIESAGHRMTLREEDELQTGMAVFVRAEGRASLP